MRCYRTTVLLPQVGLFNGGFTYARSHAGCAEELSNTRTCFFALLWPVLRNGHFPVWIGRTGQLGNTVTREDHEKMLLEFGGSGRSHLFDALRIRGALTTLPPELEGDELNKSSPFK